MSTPEGTRRCPRCKHSKDFDEFYRRKTGRYAGQHYGWCKQCNSEYHKKRYECEDEYRAIAKAQAGAWAAGNPERHAENCSRWKAENSEYNRQRDRKRWHARQQEHTT